MFQKRYYIVLVILIGLAALVYAIVIGKRGSEKTSIPVVVKKDALEKEKIKSQIEIIREYMEKGENDSAIELANKYLKSNPADTKVVALLTEAYISKNELSNAEAIIKKTISIKPEDPWLYKTLGHIYTHRAHKEGDFDTRNNYFSQALQQIEKGLSYQPDNIWLLGDLAQVYSDLGDKAKANETLDKALRIDPNSESLKKVKDYIAAK